ncbi:MAG: 30S ribosome-binding factor RbfA [bacterium]
MTRVNELLRREIGTALYRIITEPDCDLSTVTVTHVVTGSDLRSAHVFVSVRGKHAEQQKVLGLLRHHRADIQEIIHKNIILKYTPLLSFSLDTSLADGDRVLGILHGLEEEPHDDTTV